MVVRVAVVYGLETVEIKRKKAGSQPGRGRNKNNEIFVGNDQHGWD